MCTHPGLDVALHVHVLTSFLSYPISVTAKKRPILGHVHLARERGCAQLLLLGRYCGMPVNSPDPPRTR